MKSLYTDIGIVGGGLVGALLALLLAREGYSVLMVEKKILRDVPAEDLLDTRTLGLSYGTVTLFQKWGFADAILENGVPVTHIHVSDQGQSGIVNIDAKNEGLPHLGYSVSFNRLLAAMQKKVEDHPNIHCLEGVVSDVSFNVDQAEVTIAGQVYPVKLLLGADGADSIVRKKMGVGLKEYDYGQTALIGKVSCARGKSGWAFERFTKEGPLALLPHQDSTMTLVWAMPSSLAKMRKQLPESVLCQDVQKIMGYRAGVFQALGHLVAYPLKRLTSEHIFQGCVGLLGNAAHLLHPVAGQGFNLSVRDVLILIEVVRRRGKAGLDASIWPEYAALSHTQQRMITGVTGSFLNIFERTEAPIRWGRSAALHALEHLPCVKTKLNDVMIGRV